MVCTNGMACLSTLAFVIVECYATQVPIQSCVVSLAQVHASEQLYVLIDSHWCNGRQGSTECPLEICLELSLAGQAMAIVHDHGAPASTVDSWKPDGCPSRADSLIRDSSHCIWKVVSSDRLQASHCCHSTCRSHTPFRTQAAQAWPPLSRSTSTPPRHGKAQTAIPSWTSSYPSPPHCKTSSSNAAASGTLSSTPQSPCTASSSEPTFSMAAG